MRYNEGPFSGRRPLGFDSEYTRTQRRLGAHGRRRRSACKGGFCGAAGRGAAWTASVKHATSVVVVVPRGGAFDPEADADLTRAARCRTDAPQNRRRFSRREVTAQRRDEAMMIALTAGGTEDANPLGRPASAGYASLRLQTSPACSIIKRLR